MPRTLTPELSNALDNQTIDPVIRGWFSDDQVRTTEAAILKYKIHHTSLEADIYCPTTLPGSELAIERGVKVNGTEYTVSTLAFTIQSVKRVKDIVTVYGELGVIDTYYTASGDVSYKTAIDTWLGSVSPQGFTGTYKKPTAAWLNYQFLPDGRNIVCNNALAYIPLLRQKYLIYITDYQGNSPLIFAASDTFAGTLDHTIPLTKLDTWGTKASHRRFLWRDEANSIHYSAAQPEPIHNLGYLESTASAPPVNGTGGQYANYNQDTKVVLPIHLKYLTGDKVKFVSTDGSEVTEILDVTEIFDPTLSPSWRVELQPLQYFTSTEGGALPSTIEAAAPYTPLNVSRFNNVLSAADNNVQAAFETLDDHEHSNYLTDAASDGKTYGRKNNTWSEANSSGGTWGSITGTLSNQTDLQNALDAKSATTHNHTGTYEPTNANIQNHISSTSNPHGTSDANLAVTDVTTNNVSTSKHGFVPKAPNNAAKSLNGAGAWTVPSGLFTAIANQYDIFGIASTGGAGWTGTINGAPSGPTVTYTHVSGYKNSLVPAATTQLGKQRLYNLTRGTSALISTSNGSSTITLTANAPAGWANGDSITTLSRTVSGGYNFIDIEITSGELLNRPSGMVYLTGRDSGGAGYWLWAHPLTTFAAPKLAAICTNVASVFVYGTYPIALASNVFSVWFSASGAATADLYIRQLGYYT
jgi:hypothetical protein